MTAVLAHVGGILSSRHAEFISVSELWVVNNEILKRVQDDGVWAHVGGGFVHVDGRFLHVDGRFVHVDGRFLHVDGRFVHVDGRFLHVDGRFLHIDGRFLHVDVVLFGISGQGI
ncbi:hypothetical protein [Colwellia hornerae]|uniref:Uncharacterized protein n=2 Tax=Colwellia hornerae TaxID=89402 RepID=A0A5C6QKR2_9GAMM|nr:hypothetical protein [Colwellia hornerae]TWX54077.1 hypothetical protein ESZ28_08480 [Colwellia hornerae]TWX60852.1 hypothetical protein ESZ26_07255 [Colwellia hornerae]TWX69182.1 hypothetical protein ESZ27_06015 [Colwellia hornerae]